MRELPTGFADPLLEELLGNGVRVRVAVTGISMGRTLKAGDTVILSPPGTNHPGPGDLVLFHNPVDSRLVLHRVVRRRPGPDRPIQTRGDALLRLDDPVPTHQVLGRVVEIQRPRESGPRVHRQDVPWSRAGARLRAWFSLLQSGFAYGVNRYSGGRLFRSVG